MRGSRSGVFSIRATSVALLTLAAFVTACSESAAPSGPEDEPGPQPPSVRGALATPTEVSSTGIGITVLPGLDEGTARAIDNSSVVYGDGVSSAFTDSRRRAFRWDGSDPPTELEEELRESVVADANDGQAVGIDDVGNVAGIYLLSGDGGAFFKPDGASAFDIGEPAFLEGIRPTVGDAGGTGLVVGGGPAWTWNNEIGVTELDGSFAYATNGSVVVGRATNPVTGNTEAAFLGGGSSPDFLGTLGGSFSVSHDVNGDGWVVGVSETAEGDRHAFVWTPGNDMVDLGPDHQRTLQARNNLAVTLRHLGELEAAERVHRNILTAWRSREGGSDRRAADALQNLAVVLHERGALAEAEARLLEVRDIYDAVLEPDHYVRAYPRLTLASVRIDRGDYEGAERVVREAIRILGSTLPDSSYVIAAARCRLGRALAGQGRRSEARDLLEGGVQTLARTAQPSVRYEVECRRALAELYRELGREDLARPQIAEIRTLERSGEGAS